MGCGLSEGNRGTSRVRRSWITRERRTMKSICMLYNLQIIVNSCTSFNERVVLDKWKDNLLNCGNEGSCIMCLFQIAECQKF